MKPTWGIRKLNEYSVDKNTAIIITDSEKDNYYWADIPDGSLLVNDITGNLSIKLTGESDWVPMGIRKDGTEKLVKDSIINVEYYTIVKFELEHNRFYYHDREEITRIGKIVDGKAQFKVGSGLYLPGTNQLEVLINDSVHRNTIDGGLEEINMKYFQIDFDDIRLGSTVTVRYINYERLSELYPFIYVQEQVPWFFEDKDLWINPSESTTTDGLTITPLSYHVKYVDNNQAEIIVFTTKNSHLVATRKLHEYLNINTKKNISRFKVNREADNFYINLFSTYPGYKTSFSKVLIKGTKTDEEKLTIDAEVLYPNSAMARIIVKTQLGNVVTFNKESKKLYSAQNLGAGVQYSLARGEAPYDVKVIVRNPINGITKEKVLTIKERRINLVADIEHITTVTGTNITVNTIPLSSVKISKKANIGLSTLIQGIADNTGRFAYVAPLTTETETYVVNVSNAKADNTVEDEFTVKLHLSKTPLSVNVVDGYDGLSYETKGTKALNIQAESGSTILVKNAQGNLIHTFNPRNLSVEDVAYRIPLFYYPETKTFIVEAVKEDKVPESKTVIVEGYKKIDSVIPFDVNQVTFSNRRWATALVGPKKTKITVYDANNNIIRTEQNTEYATLHSDVNTFSPGESGLYYRLRQKNKDYNVKFVFEHPLYKTKEIVRTLPGANLPEYNISLLNSYVINPYADMYNSNAYQALEIRVGKLHEDALIYTDLYLTSNPELKDLVLSYADTSCKPTLGGSELKKKLNGSISSYEHIYGKIDLSNVETLEPLPLISDYLQHAYSDNGSSVYFVFKVNNFDDLLSDRNIVINVNGKVTPEITVPTNILHWKNLEKLITPNKNIESVMNEKYTEIYKFTKSLLRSPVNNSYSVNNNIKYIHPNLVKLVVLKHNANIHTKLNSILDKLKELKYFNDTYRTHTKGSEIILTCWNELFDYSYKYLDFNSEILLFPNKMSYFYVSAYFNDNTFSIVDSDFSPAMYLNCDINDSNVIHVKSNNQKFLTDFYNIFNTVGIRRFNTNIDPLEKASSVKLAISYSGKKIPSFFLGDYDHLAVNAIIVAKNVEEVSDNGLPFFHNSFILIDYTKIKKLNNFSFSNPFISYSGIKSKNIGPNNNITIVLKDEEYIDNGINYRLVDLPNNAQYSIVDKMFPFPSFGSFSDPFNLIIKSGNNHLKIQDILFNNSAIELITIEAPSITFIDEEGDVISHKNIPRTPKILGMNRSYNTIKNRYNIPDNLAVNNVIKNFSHFGFTNLKFVDLRKYTNYYLHPKEFFNSEALDKIIFPSNYIGRYFNENIDAQECLAQCRAIYIDNLDFVTSSLNVAGFDSFLSTSRLKTEVNINYFKEFKYSAFSSSNVEDFVYRKRTLTTDYLGEEVVVEDGYLESLEKGNLFSAIVADTSFYRTNMTQQSFNRIKNNFKNFARNSFYEAKQIKEVILDGSNLKLFDVGFKNVKLEKFVIDSPTIEAIILEDSVLSNNKLNESPDNYKINAPNAKVFIFENKGGYSTYHTLNMPNLEFSYFAKPEKRKTFGYNFDKNENPSITARHVDDFGGVSSGIDISYYNDAESIAKANLEELNAPPGIFTTLFSNVVNKNNIKVKKIILDFSTNTSYSSGLIYNYTPTVSFSYDINYVSRFMEKYRWPALEEIVIKGGRMNEEYTNLGVKVKYVQA